MGGSKLKKIRRAHLDNRFDEVPIRADRQYRLFLMVNSFSRLLPNGYDVFMKSLRIGYMIRAKMCKSKHKE